MREIQLVYATGIAQATVAVALGILLLWYQRRLGHRYLAEWGWSWVAYATHVGGAVLHGQLVARGVEATSVLAPLSAFATGAAWLQAGLLLAGARNLSRPETARPQWHRVLPLSAAGAGLALLFALSPAGNVTGPAFDHGVRSLVLAAAFLASGLMLWPGRARGMVGMRLLVASFVGFALQHVHYVVRGGSALLTVPADGLPVWAGFIDLVLQWFVGAGMAIALLEAERASALQAVERAEYLAYHDALTGLPNRKLFLDRLMVELAKAKRKHEHVAVMFLDVDRFKLVNDSLGHAAGDRLLVMTGERITSCIRVTDTLARLGGDEFALLFPATDAEAAATISGKILEALRSPVHLAEQDVYATGSIGIAIYPEDGIDADSLMRNADAAMYRAKEVGRDTFRFYRAAMNTRAATRLSLETALRRAVDRQEFRLFFQPVVDCATGDVRRVEALLRWQHPELGLLLPGRFMEALEATGLIIEVGHWTLTTALASVRGWMDSGRSVGVTVNLAPRHFTEPKLVATIERMLLAADVPSNALELEITESTALSNVERAIDVTRQLRALGVRISLDDFGAGYSAMNHLRRLPVDVLKLDQSFVQGAPTNRMDAAVVQAVTHLAHTVGMEVVAEGVEEREQMAFMREAGVDLAQGFLIAEPRAEEELDLDPQPLDYAATITAASRPGRGRIVVETRPRR